MTDLRKTTYTVVSERVVKSSDGALRTVKVDRSPGSPTREAAARFAAGLAESGQCYKADIVEGV